MVTAFSFGYEGWGPHTQELLRALDSVERARGYAPPLLVDTRIRKTVRAEGFRGNAPNRLLGARYQWMPELGNRSILTKEQEIVIDDPSAVGKLLDFILDSSRQNRRVLFFCSCGPIEICHRQIVGSLLLEEARRRGVDLEVVEWPGGSPMMLTLPVSEEVLTKVAKGRKSVPLEGDSSHWFATPWYSTVVLTAGDRALPISVGPARWRDGWILPVLATADEPQELAEVIGEWREAEGLESRRARPGRTVALNEPSRRMKPWLAKVYAGDFAEMPLRITEGEFFELHSAIDGYRIAEEFGYGDLSGLADLSWRMVRQFEETGRWSGSALELWLCLFFQCRAARHSDGSLDEGMWRSLYQALRVALQNLTDTDPHFEPTTSPLPNFS